MKKLVLLAAMLSLASVCWAGSARRNAVDRLNNAAKVLHEIMDAPDQRIPDEIMERAKCVAVIPKG
jgi:lipid-binding SYLF domain-containing protein